MRLLLVLVHQNGLLLCVRGCLNVGRNGRESPRRLVGVWVRVLRDAVEEMASIVVGSAAVVPIVRADLLLMLLALDLLHVWHVFLLLLQLPSRGGNVGGGLRPGGGHARFEASAFETVLLVQVVFFLAAG